MVAIKIEEDNISQNALGEQEYIITVSITNVILSNKKGEEIAVESLEFKEVYVGWMPG